MDEIRGAKLLSIGGTAIYVQLSFVILAAVFVILDLEQKARIEEALLWVPILFISILFHEASHAITIALLGFGSSIVILGGFGGVTVNLRRSKPWQEILIAVAGPAASFGLAILLSLVRLNFPALEQDRMMRSMLPLMILANIAWAVFNILPIYPLDGGQMSKHLARYFTDDHKAVRFSAISSMVLATVILIASILLRSYLTAVIAAMLLFQNFQRLQSGDPF